MFGLASDKISKIIQAIIVVPALQMTTQIEVEIVGKVAPGCGRMSQPCRNAVPLCRRLKILCG